MIIVVDVCLNENVICRSQKPIKIKRFVLMMALSSGVSLPDMPMIAPFSLSACSYSSTISSSTVCLDAPWSCATKLSLVEYAFFAHKKTLPTIFLRESVLLFLYCSRWLSFSPIMPRLRRV